MDACNPNVTGNGGNEDAMCEPVNTKEIKFRTPLQIVWYVAFLNIENLFITGNGRAVSNRWLFPNCEINKQNELNPRRKIQCTNGKAVAPIKVSND